MKRFIVLMTYWIPDAENGPEFDTEAVEPVADFDTEDEAKAFISDQKHPDLYHVEDSEAGQDAYEGWPDDDEDLYDDEDYYEDDEDHYRDNDDSDYDLDDDREDFHADDGRYDDMGYDD